MPEAICSIDVFNFISSGINDRCIAAQIETNFFSGSKYLEEFPATGPISSCHSLSSATTMNRDCRYIIARPMQAYDSEIPREISLLGFMVQLDDISSAA